MQILLWRSNPNSPLLPIPIMMPPNQVQYQHYYCLIIVCLFISSVFLWKSCTLRKSTIRLLTSMVKCKLIFLYLSLSSSFLNIRRRWIANRPRGTRWRGGARRGSEIRCTRGSKCFTECRCGVYGSSEGRRQAGGQNGIKDFLLYLFVGECFNGVSCWCFEWPKFHVVFRLLLVNLCFVLICVLLFNFLFFPSCN